MTRNSMSRPNRRRWWWTLWIVMGLSAIVIAVYAVPPYLSGNPANSKIPLNPQVALHFLSLAAHAVPGGLALIIGPFQFLSRLRTSRPGLHRIAGRAYMISVMIAAIVSLFAATVSENGLAAQVGFYLLTVLWLYSLTKGYLSIRRGQVGLHRIWMIRNYALTFAAVALRIYLLVGVLVKQAVPSLQFDQIYTASVWASILINVAVVEYFIVQRTLASLARGRQRPGGTTAAGPTAARPTTADTKSAAPGVTVSG